MNWIVVFEQEASSRTANARPDAVCAARNLIGGYMNRRTSAFLFVALAALAPGVPASAHGYNLGLVGSSVSYGTLDLATYAGKCDYTREAIGIGGSGMTYRLVGIGTAGGSYRGIPVVATGVRCRLLLPSTVVVSGPEYLPGAVAETDTTHTTNDASGGSICTTVYAVLRQTPPGGTGNTIAFPEQCA